MKSTTLAFVGMLLDEERRGILKLDNELVEAVVDVLLATVVIGMLGGISIQVSVGLLAVVVSTVFEESFVAL